MDNLELEESKVAIERLEADKTKLNENILALELENNRLNNEIEIFKKLVAVKDALLVEASRR